MKLKRPEKTEAAPDQVSGQSNEPHFMTADLHVYTFVLTRMHLMRLLIVYFCRGFFLIACIMFVFFLIYIKRSRFPLNFFVFIFVFLSSNTSSILIYVTHLPRHMFRPL